ncbi:hypothetical protein [Vibrio atypicus]|jgi:hypothetical protein|uniref:hypothetical protein n=1 Tax=Vibrio atypicus TaxID=558271 RepID=UPI001357CA25|nr:hypothetical protein [Vibrio atypicus]
MSNKDRFINLTLWLLFVFMPFHVDATTLSMHLHGQIDNRCEINFNSGNVIDLSGRKSETLPFDLFCNQPFNIALSSKNGGLKLKSDADGHLTNYLFEIDINKTKTSEKFDSQSLLSPNSVNSFGVIPFTTQGEIRITLENILLFAGQYSDVVEIDIYPSIHNVTK